jgi:hypothetical protein
MDYEGEWGGGGPGHSWADGTSDDLRLNPQLVGIGHLTWTVESAHLQSPVPRDLHPSYLLSSDLRLNPQLVGRGRPIWIGESARSPPPVPKQSHQLAIKFCWIKGKYHAIDIVLKIFAF